MLIYHNVDFNGYQAQNLKLHVTGVAPVAEKGKIYLDSTDDVLKWHNGTAWIPLPTNYLSIGDNISNLVNDAGYLTSFTETDPIFVAHVAAGILSSDIINWNTAFGWGDHSVQGYLTSYTSTDTLDQVTTRGSVTANNVTVGGLTVSGNLVVSGTTTTINTEEIKLADNIITLNSNATGPATENSGLIIERGTDVNRGLRWNESSNVWQIQKDDNLYYEIAVVSTTGKIYAETITGSQLVSHNFNSRDISVHMYDTVTNEVYFADWVSTTVSAVTVTFYSAPTNPIRILITKQEAS